MFKAERLHDRQVQSPFRYLLYGWRWWLRVVWTLLNSSNSILGTSSLRLASNFHVELILSINSWLQHELVWRWIARISNSQCSGRIELLYMQQFHQHMTWLELLNWTLWFSIFGARWTHTEQKNNSDESEKIFRSMFIPEKWKSIWKHILCSTQMNKTRE